MAEGNYSRKVEDYLEAILNVIEDKGYARIKDIAKAMKVSPPSAVEMARKLDREGLVRYRKYDGITFTRKGVQIAKMIKDRHETIRKFLEILNVPPDIANKDACTIEHHLDPKTLEQLKKFILFIEKAPSDPKWLTHFKAFCRTGSHDCKTKRTRKS
jgi:DtxR family Mn-dependent transcriptional regulator